MAEPARVVFLGVGRLYDKAVLCSSHDQKLASREKAEVDDGFVSILREQSGRCYSGWRDKAPLEYVDGTLSVLADDEGACLYGCGIRGRDYPERLALQLLRELKEKTVNTQGPSLLQSVKPDSLSRPMKRQMKELMKKYDDVAGLDKTAAVQQTVDQLKDTMQDNVKRVLETHQTLDNLEEKSDSMSKQANHFLRQSVDLRRQMQWRNMKVKIMAGAVGGSLILYLCSPLLSL